MSTILYIAIGFLSGTILSGALLGLRLLKAEKDKANLEAQITANQNASSQASDQFKVTAQEALQKAQESFLTLAEERLKNAQKDGSHDLEKRKRAIDNMIKPVYENLRQLTGAIEQIKGTDQALRQDLSSLSRETAKLVGALRDPSAQGQWGEFILEGLLEKSGLMKGIHYDTQVHIQSETGAQRPDAVIRMQDGFNIIIDSKAPINQFTQRLSEDLSEADYNMLMQNLAKQVKDHVKKLSAKGYWENIESPDFTVMFLPSEQLYSMALRADPTLVDYAAKNDVIIASPTLLMSLLRVVSLSWRQVELAQNAQEISNAGQELYKRFLKFTDHFEKVGKHLQSAMGGYDAAVGSMERQILPAARKFKDLQASASNVPEVPEMSTIRKRTVTGSYTSRRASMEFWTTSRTKVSILPSKLYSAAFPPVLLPLEGAASNTHWIVIGVPLLVPPRIRGYFS